MSWPVTEARVERNLQDLSSTRRISQLRDPDPGADRLPMMAAIGSRIGQFIKRKRVEEERDRSLRLIQSIIDQSTAAIYVKDTKGRYLFINSWFTRIFGHDTVDVKGQTDHDLFPARLAEAYRENDRKVLIAGKPLEFEEMVPHPDGEHFFLSRKYPVRDAAGITYALFGISTDITGRKLAEAAILHDISHLIDGMPPVLKRIAALASELTPGQSDRLADAVFKIDTLVSEVQAVTRTTCIFNQRRGDDTASPAVVRRCNDRVRRWLEVVPRLFPDDVIEVKTRYSLAEGEPFLADPDGIVFTLRNLWTNAKGAFKDLQRISYQIVFSVSLETLANPGAEGVDASYIVLRVADNGNGIPAEMTDRIFQRRLYCGNGHGLGSWIIRWVMDDHQGLIRFATDERVGTLIELWFPRLVPPRPGWTIGDQREIYRTLRDDAGPVRRINEKALLTLLNCE
jgi:PAS domain S-box-containing protein